MAQKGRPRNYDSDRALDEIMMQFWRKGYTATSMDDLATITEMKKPSLYAAFGNKERLYQLAIDKFSQVAQQRYSAALKPEYEGEPLYEKLSRFLQTAIVFYTENEGLQGCMVLSTAAAEVHHPQIQSLLSQVVCAQEKMIFDYLTREKDALLEPATIQLLAKTLLAFLHSISVRARAGENKEELSGMLDAGQQFLRFVLK